jgi:hypothetical protein
MHALTIVNTRRGRHSWRARCSCGWKSWGYPTESAAELAADDHQRRERLKAIAGEPDQT